MIVSPKGVLRSVVTNIPSFVYYVMCSMIFYITISNATKQKNKQTDKQTNYVVSSSLSLISLFDVRYLVGKEMMVKQPHRRYSLLQHSTGVGGPQRALKKL